MLRLRSATADDLDAVAALHVRAWRDTYSGSIIPPEVLDRIDEARRRADWSRWLDQWGEEGLLRLAELEGELVGFCFSGRADPPSHGARGEILKLYVRTDRQGMGIGRTLMADAARFLTERGLEPIVV